MKELERYHKQLKNWYLVKLMSLVITFMLILTVIVVNMINQEYLLLIASIISMMAVWYLGNIVWNYAKPQPPISMLREIAKGVEEDESTKN